MKNRLEKKIKIKKFETSYRLQTVCKDENIIYCKFTLYSVQQIYDYLTPNIFLPARKVKSEKHS